MQLEFSLLTCAWIHHASVFAAVSALSHVGPHSRDAQYAARKEFNQYGIYVDIK